MFITIDQVILFPLYKMEQSVDDICHKTFRTNAMGKIPQMTIIYSGF
jgi:hypothetical protein